MPIESFGLNLSSNQIKIPRNLSEHRRRDTGWGLRHLIGGKHQRRSAARQLVQDVTLVEHSGCRSRIRVELEGAERNS